MTRGDTGAIAVLWRGDQRARAAATAANNRFHAVFEALAAAGIRAEPAVYSEEFGDEVRARLLNFDGVLVWVDPLSEGRDRAALDAMLRDVAKHGVWISAHPDVTLKMGVKAVLHRTRKLGWGTDTRLYRDAAAFHAEFPRRLRSGGPRVVKQNRGNGGQGVWSVEAVGPEPMVRVLEARRGSRPETIALADFMRRCEAYFGPEGCIVDQPFQPRLPEGMIRCYMVTDKVVGFGHQLVKALIVPPPDGPEPPPGPRIMHPAEVPMFQALREKMEAEWTPEMMRLLDIDRDSLPLIWDADFLHGPRDAAGEDSYVLCEINVSSVFPIPGQAPEAIARAAVARLRASKKI